MASLPILKDPNTNLMLMQNRWSAILNPVIANPLSQGTILTDVPLVIGSNTINHLLQRNLQGYILTGLRGAYSQIYQITSQTPTLTLILNSSAKCTVDILVF